MRPHPGFVDQLEQGMTAHGPQMLLETGPIHFEYGLPQQTILSDRNNQAHTDRLHFLGRRRASTAGRRRWGTSGARE